LGALFGLGLVLQAAQASTEDMVVDLRNARGQDAGVAPAKDRSEGLEIRFQPGKPWPGATLDAPRPWDWSQSGILVLDLANPGPRAVTFSVRIDDDLSADGRQHCRTATGTVPQQGAARFAIRFAPDPMDLGMRGLPGPADGHAQVLTAQGEGPFDRRHIVSFRIFMTCPTQPETLLVHGAQLSPATDLKGIVDRFGQYAGSDWPGKVHQESEFAARRAAEESELTAEPVQPDRDRFGGWATGPAQKATSFFRIARVDGKWWLVDPDGRLFFSSGIDCVTVRHETVVTGRESLFSWLPTENDPVARYYGHNNHIIRGPVRSGRTFDFYRANLARKYGENAEAAWRDSALKRLPAWGFNTIGNWSDHALYRNGKVPYLATSGIGGSHARISSGSDYWGKMHDPFDPQFARNVEQSLRPVVAAVKGDPWCIGYFIDNELSWGGFDQKKPQERFGLAIGALSAGSDSPARQAFLAQLKAKHGTIADLNAAWRTKFADWKELEESSWKPERTITEGLQADFAAFVTQFARRYFETINDVQKKLDPDHLYLGCRFAWRTPEAVAASAEYCDVVSFNIYKRRVDEKEWAILETLGKPAIIGEFHVGALDRGMFHTGLVASSSQDERASIFREYVESVLDNPALVGCHWFQYGDQPLTGRSFDGENYNIGFVTVTDSAYPEMVAAARAVHRHMYARRAAGGR
jgi:hypothetical protein